MDYMLYIFYRSKKYKEGQSLLFCTTVLLYKLNDLRLFQKKL